MDRTNNMLFHKSASKLAWEDSKTIADCTYAAARHTDQHGVRNAAGLLSDGKRDAKDVDAIPNLIEGLGC
jgi:hypothetical protein